MFHVEHSVRPEVYVQPADAHENKAPVKPMKSSRLPTLTPLQLSPPTRPPVLFRGSRQYPGLFSFASRLPGRQPQSSLPLLLIPSVLASWPRSGSLRTDWLCSSRRLGARSHGPVRT